MNILPVDLRVIQYLAKRGLLKKFEKQAHFFRDTPFHPSLNTELMEPKGMRVWSFRVDKKYRAIFIFRARDTIEVLEVNDHYQ